MHERKLWEKKMIDVHTVNKKKKTKKKKNKQTNKETKIFAEIICRRKKWLMCTL